MASNLIEQRDACLRFLFRVAMPRVLIRLLRELKNGTSADREELARSAQRVKSRLKSRLISLKTERELTQVITHQLREDKLEDQVRNAYLFSQVTVVRNQNRILAHRVASLEDRLVMAVPDLGDLPPRGREEMLSDIRKTYNLSEEDLGGINPGG